ncbi:translation initiation factor IF-1 [Striga asiatica]|uniref:Translation initiation factor IF-1 n=1 Tax=Striga asiatica TaxID=4170 RepID=A0A5A7QPY4_STRAF|nr:translation initiation factor IF-1 [Striga asiatica]
MVAGEASRFIGLEVEGDEAGEIGERRRDGAAEVVGGYVEAVKGGDFRRDLDGKGIAGEVDELEVQRARGERVSLRWLSRRSRRRSWSRDAKASMGQRRLWKGWTTAVTCRW